MSLRLLALALLVLSGCAELFVAPEHRAHVAGLEAQARAGDPLAQLDLSDILERGTLNDSTGAALVGWRRNSARAEALRAEAARTLRARAYAGDARSMTRLGVLHHNGFGVARNTAEAARLWRTAAGLGDAEAAFFVGGIVESRTPEALPWLVRAAEAGHGQAAYHLHLLYRGGHSVTADSAAALIWLERATEAGDEWAVRDLRGFHAYHAGR